MHPVLIKIGPVEIRYYGLMYVIAIITGIIILKKEAKRKNLNITTEDIYSYAFWVVLGGIFGARIYYVLFMWKKFYAQHPTEIFAIWHGGLAIHGGIIGGVLTTYLYTKIKKIKFFDLLDSVAPALALGQAFGRFGNFMNGDAHGLPTKLPWGIVFPPGSIAGDQFPGQPLHPVMLYELVLNLISFFILWKLRKRNHRSGFIISVYLFNYGIIRFFVSFFRADSLMIGGFRGAQIISVIFVIISIIFIWKFKLWGEKPSPATRRIKKA